MNDPLPRLLRGNAERNFSWGEFVESPLKPNSIGQRVFLFFPVSVSIYGSCLNKVSKCRELHFEGLKQKKSQIKVV